MPVAVVFVCDVEGSTVVVSILVMFDDLDDSMVTVVLETVSVVVLDLNVGGLVVVLSSSIVLLVVEDVLAIVVVPITVVFSVGKEVFIVEDIPAAAELVCEVGSIVVTIVSTPGVVLLGMEALVEVALSNAVVLFTGPEAFTVVETPATVLFSSDGEAREVVVSGFFVLD